LTWSDIDFIRVSHLFSRFYGVKGRTKQNGGTEKKMMLTCRKTHLYPLL